MLDRIDYDFGKLDNLKGNAPLIACHGAVIDVDYPDIIALRERLHGPIEGVRTEGSSVTESAWWDEVPTDRTTLVWPRGS